MALNEAFAELERSVETALAHYSNVHRGSGHNSMVSTFLYEQAREIVLEYLELRKGKYTVIFCTPGRAAALKSQLSPGSYKSISSNEIGLPLGVCALASRKKALPGGAPFQTGGGTTRLVSPGWVIWADAPDKFEAGTPAIINIIAFARALQLVKQSGIDTFRNTTAEIRPAADILRRDELEKYSGKQLLGELGSTMIGHDVLVPTATGNEPYINLDNAASTPSFAPVWNAVCQTWRQPAHVLPDIINEVRSICAEVLNAPLSDYDFIFTSNTTEAINVTAESLRRGSTPGEEYVVVNSLLEHTSNDLPWRLIPDFSLVRINIDSDGLIDPEELERLLTGYNVEALQGRKRIRLVALSGASNVLGVFNNLEEISKIVHRYGARLLVDAAQLVAHRKVDMKKCAIDYLAFSAHKMYAPFGTGVLIARKGLLNFTPEEMSLIHSSGEENKCGIAALGKALVLLQRVGLDLVRSEEQLLTAQLLRGLAKIEGLQIYGIKDPDSPVFDQKGGVVVFSLKNIFANVIARDLALLGGIGIRYGCHCAHLLVKQLVGVGPSLERFQGLIVKLFPWIRLPGLARVSLGIGNTEQEIKTLIQVLQVISIQPKVTALKEVERQMKDFCRDIAQKVYAPQPVQDHR
jgi:selenocysteine lyase/cysteine desulfurase